MRPSRHQERPRRVQAGGRVDQADMGDERVSHARPPRAINHSGGPGGIIGPARPSAPRRPSPPAPGSGCAPGRRRPALSISTPRFIGPGCITSAIRRRARKTGGVQAEENRKYSRALGTWPWLIRSFCRRSIMTMSAPSSPASISLNTVTPSRSTAAGISRRRPDHPDAAAHGGQQMDVAPRDPAMQHVPANGDGQPLQTGPRRRADRQRIQQRLGRVLVQPIPLR